MVATKEFPILIDYLIKFTTQSSATSSLQCPAFICVGDTQPHVVSFSLSNKLSNTNLDKDILGSYKCVLRVSGYRFRPSIASSLITTVQEIPPAGAAQYLTTSYEIPLQSIESGGQLNLSANLTLSASDQRNSIPIGSKVFIRPELYHQSILLEALPPTTVRVVPDSLSIVDEVTFKDVLIFANSLLTVEDYLLIRQYIATLGFRVHFLDCQYWSTPPVATTNGTINSLVWEKFKGKATILWLPTQENMNCLPNADLQAHLECGGSLICTINSTFRWSKQNATPPEKPTRRCVLVPESFQLHNLTETDSVVDSGSKKKIQGKILPLLAMCILSTLSLHDKLRFFIQNRRECDVILGETMIENQNIIPPSCGCLPCFSSAPKIVPIDSSPLTIQDCLCASLRTDVEIDLQFYPKHGNNNLCYAIQEIILFTSQNTLSNASNAAEINGFLHAILISSQVDNEVQHDGGTHRKNWKTLKTEIKKILKNSLVASKVSSVNPQSYARRLSGIEIISTGTNAVTRPYRFNDKVAYAFAVSNGKK